MPRASSRPAARTTGTIWLRLGVLLLAALPFLEGASFEFINVDDADYVTNNRLVAAGITPDSLWRIATEYHGSNWHPLTMLTFLVEYSLFGPKPGVYHITNIALHAATACAVFVWLRDMTGWPLRSFLVAVLFGCHPLRVESVAWVAERKDVLCALFWMLSLRAYTRYAIDRSQRRLWVVFLYGALALLSKPMAVTLPCVLLLLDYWPLNRWRPWMPDWLPAEPLSASLSADRAELFSRVSAEPLGRLILEKAPLFAMALGAAVLTLLAQSGSQSMLSLDTLSLGERIWTPFIGIVLYLDKTLRPFALAAFYPRPLAGYSTVFAGFCAALVVACTVFAVIQMRRRPPLFVGWFWFVGVLFPVSGVLQAGQQLIADRYTYLPSIGLWLAFVWSVPAPRTSRARRLLGGAAVAAIVALEVLAFQQASQWRDSITLFEHTLSVTRDNPFAHNALAVAYSSVNNDEAAQHHFEQSLAVDPQNVVALIGRSMIAERRGDLPAARQALEQALEVDQSTPRSAVTLADFLDRRGDLPAAIQILEEAVRKHPHSALVRNHLGTRYLLTGRDAPARECFEAAVATDPNFGPAWDNLARLHSQRGEDERAIACFEAALRADPGMHYARFLLAQTYYKQGDIARASSHVNAVLKIAPHFTPAAQLAKAIANGPR